MPASAPTGSPSARLVATLFGMYVARRARGRGVGEALVSAVLEEASVTASQWSSSKSTSGNTAARALYERCGFVATGALHPHPRNDELDEIEMVRTCDASQKRRTTRRFAVSRRAAVGQRQASPDVRPIGCVLRVRRDGPACEG